MVMVLFALSGPRQFARLAVIVYCQLPRPTEVSVQVRAASVPAQLLPTVASAPVEAL